MKGTTNMFSAQKTKLHGMHSAKWTTKDKITQYKGLINLYTRDRKIIEVDANVNTKKLQRELTALRTNVEKDRLRLDNAVKGDRQQLHNELSEHRELQLAFQNNFDPHKLLECVHQLNFAKRKNLDKLVYENSLRMKKLIDLKQEQALLEDRLKYAYLVQIKDEKNAQIITGKVQDAILKKEGATAIKQIYKEIIDIMKKDALYFDAIITTIENDGFSQSKCFLGATTLGQLATEYLDDRRQEYDTLEKIVIQDMEARKKDIQQLEQQLHKASAGLKELLRKDSDINTCNVHLPDTSSMETLRKDITEIEKTLTFLKNQTLVYSFESIYPCLSEQLEQKKRLRIMSKKFEYSRDQLLNKFNHAELMSARLDNTMVETTTSYKFHKNNLTQEIKKYKEMTKANNAKLQYKLSSTADVRIALRQLLQLSKLIKMPQEEKKKSQQTTPYSTFPSMMADSLAGQKPQEPEKDEIEALKILSLIISRFSFLMSNYQEKFDDSKSDDAFKMFEYMMCDRMIDTSDTVHKNLDVSLLEGLYQEASQQLTREDIKRQSAEIVAANTKNDDMVPLFIMPKKAKFQKTKK